MLLHALIPASRANGPGIRAVVFFQGCTLGCPGCFNSETHAFRGAEVTVDAVVEQVLGAHKEHPLEGVTFSGGEPMQQADSLLTLIYTLRQRAPELSFGMFSGYTEYELDLGRYWMWGSDYSERVRGRIWRTIQVYLDFAVLGRFDQTQPCILPLRSSRNQVLRLFSGRYNEQDFSEQLVEVTVHTDGRAELTGFPTLGLPW
jgi:anaerobic ribonucleoside-triphosphate reductase activating protein